MIPFLNWCLRQNIRGNEGRLRVNSIMGLSHWTAGNDQYGILWEHSSIRKKRHWEKKIESGAQIPKTLYAPKTSWCVWGRGGETSGCKDAFCSVYWWSSRISRKGKQWGENLLLTLLLQITSIQGTLTKQQGVWQAGKRCATHGQPRESSKCHGLLCPPPGSEWRTAWILF